MSKKLKIVEIKKPKVTPWVCLCICVLYGFVGIGVLGWMSLRVDNYDAPIAVVFPPGIQAEESFKQVINASGSPIRFGRSGNIIIADFNNLSAEDIKLKTNALFLMNPIAAGACFLDGEIENVL